MTATIKIAPVRKSIRVNASQAHAFEVFTAGLGRWWPRDHRIGRRRGRCPSWSPPRPALVRARRGRHADQCRQGHRVGIARRFVMTWDINSRWKPDQRELRSGGQVHRGWDECDARGIRAPQVRADGRGSRRIDAQGCRRRLARNAGAVQGHRPRRRELTRRHSPPLAGDPLDRAERGAGHDIELYVFPPSPRAFKVMAVANHLGLDTTLRIVDLGKGDQTRHNMPRSIPTCACRPSRTATMCSGNRTRSGNISPAGNAGERAPAER